MINSVNIRASSLRHTKPAAVKHCSFDDYISAMEQAGIFSSDASFPEHDPRVWRQFLSLCREWSGFIPEDTISVHLGKYGFCHAPVDPDRGGQNFAGVTTLVDPFLPVSAQEFLADIPALHDSLASQSERILTDTYGYRDGYGTPGGGDDIAWLHSPVAKIDMDFETYLTSLAQERRKKFRRMARDFEETNVLFQLSQDPLTADELSVARDHLIRKWGDEEGRWALMQTLWSYAIMQYRPHQVYVMRAQDRDMHIFTQTLIHRRDTIYCQSIFKNEDMFFDGIAPFTDFKCIEALCGRHIVYFDPSCRTSLDDPETIGIAKRVTVNHDRQKPLFISGGQITDEQRDTMLSGLYFGKPA